MNEKRSGRRARAVARPIDGDLEARVGAVAKSLLPKVHKLDQDATPLQRALARSEIDGAFYWHAARADFLAVVPELRDRVRETASDDRDAQERLIRPVADQFGLPYHAVWLRVYDEAQIIELSEPDIRPITVNTPAGTRRDDHIQVDVRSALWTGERVAGRLNWYLYGPAGEGHGPTWLKPVPELADAYWLHLDFAFVPATATLPPAVRMTIFRRPDTPPMDVVDQAYELIVRGQRKWHERLVDAGAIRDKQRPAAAARAWIIGLLLHAGLSFRDAEHAAEKLGLPEVDQPTFRRDRGHLLRRAPQAAPYLYQRKAPPRP